MPTFNAYKDGSGYYIRAWTPEVGNINYKIRTTGNPIFEDYGLLPDSEISWDIIRALKSLSLIYTEKSGTIGPDEFEPDSAQRAETKLSEREAIRLLKSIQKHRTLTSDELETICSILGIEPPTTEYEELASTLEQRLLRLNPVGIPLPEYSIPTTLPTKLTLDGLSGEDLGVIISVTDVEGAELPHLGIRIVLVGGVDFPSATNVSHNVSVCSEHGIERWVVAVPELDSIEKRGEAHGQIAYLLPRLAKLLERDGYYAGDGSEEITVIVTDQSNLDV